MTKSSVEQVFRTPVAVGAPLRAVAVGDRNVFLGSCFAEHVGRRFAEACLLTTINPLGVQYNPASIARLLTTTSCEETDVVYHDGLWHSWLGDSELSRISAEECREATTKAWTRLHEELATADNLFVTLGTSHYYRYKATGEVVANCHRLPQTEFSEEELGVEDIVSTLQQALVAVHERNPKLQVVFTVSPYRYAKYGYHESQLSKSRLLLAVEQLQGLHPDGVTYFPAYEIVLDELRDYRFYAEDMLHPSERAVDYIWQRFCEAWMNDETREFLSRWEPLRRAFQHRPLHPEATAFQTFQLKLQEQLTQLQHDYPNLHLNHELFVK